MGDLMRELEALRVENQILKMRLTALEKTDNHLLSENATLRQRLHAIVSAAAPKMLKAPATTVGIINAAWKGIP